MFDAKAMPPAPLLNRTSIVRGGVVQQYDQRTGQTALQLAQEQADLLLVDVVVEKQIVTIQPVALGPERNAGEDPDLVSPPLRCAES